jgi:hypothetical protein
MSEHSEYNVIQRTRKIFAFIAIATLILTSCNTALGGSSSTPTPLGAVVPRATNNPEQYPLPALQAQATLVQNILNQPLPILLLIGLDAPRAQAQEIAVRNQLFQADLWEPSTGAPLRSEIFGVYPMRESDITAATARCSETECYRVEMYNYAKNLTTVGFVSLTDQTLLSVTTMPDTQPDLPPYLVDLAVQIASQSPEVAAALGYTPDSNDALMANTKTALNLTRCQRSRHLCVAPTFVTGKRALWAIVDLTDGVLVGVRWTDVGDPGVPTVTERSLQNDVVTQLYCDKTTSLERGDWRMDFILTSSDGLRISNVRYKDRAVLESAKLVDWHVSYSTTEAFGYSDAVGCPVFSQAAVVAFQGPTVKALTENGEAVGFALEQDFWGEQWPLPCNYYYVQRFDFYNDGRFRVVAGNNGRGCGNNGTYRPVLRIALAGENSFAEWTGSAWENWLTEAWQLQSESEPTAEGYQYRFVDSSGAGYYIVPGRGQFRDGGRGDNAFIYATLDQPDRDEGDTDMITIGPCCNVNYEQGPERFLNEETIAGAAMVLWYVPQMENDDTPGQEYCWARSAIQGGVFTAVEYPCYAGPMFVPISNP